MILNHLLYFSSSAFVYSLVLRLWAHLRLRSARRGMKEGAAPPKYDALATFVREKAKANGVVILIIGGESGNGILVETEEGTVSGAEVVGAMRCAADAIEQRERA